MTVIMSGVREMQAGIKRLNLQMGEAARVIVTEGGQMIVKAARSEFTTVVSGPNGSRVMAKGSKKGKGETLERIGRHIGGGETPPHIRTGYLARSIKTDVTHLGGTRWASVTGPRAAYGRRVELGGRFTSRSGNAYTQPPYPYLKPAYEKSLPEIEELAHRTWKEAQR